MAIGSFKLDKLFIIHIPLLVTMFRHSSQKALGCGPQSSLLCSPSWFFDRLQAGEILRLFSKTRPMPMAEKRETLSGRRLIPKTTGLWTLCSVTAIRRT
jgi:hypothetical protein